MNNTLSSILYEYKLVEQLKGKIQYCVVYTAPASKRTQKKNKIKIQQQQKTIYNKNISSNKKKKHRESHYV